MVRDTTVSSEVNRLVQKMVMHEEDESRVLSYAKQIIHISKRTRRVTGRRRKPWTPDRTREWERTTRDRRKSEREQNDE